MFTRRISRAHRRPQGHRIVWCLVGLALLGLGGWPGAPAAAAGKGPAGGTPTPGAPARPAAVTANNWTNLFPNLHAVSAVSATEAWAAGEYGHLLHYTGGAWLVVDPPALHGTPLTDIRMVSAADGWIAGGTRAFQYDGTTWQDRSAGLSPDLTITRLAVMRDDNVWAIGQRRNPAYPYFEPALVHWDGTHWQYSTPGFDPTDYLTDIAAAGPADGWLVGWTDDVTDQLPRVLHYNGTTWTPVAGPPTGIYGSLNGVWAGANGDAWVVGGVDAAGQIALYHYSGGAWTTYEVAADGGVARIAMVSATDGWATNGDQMLHWDGTAWTVVYSARDMQGIAAVAGRAWAVGSADRIYGQTGPSAWTAEQAGSPTIENLQGVYTRAPDDAWAVGAHGTALHYTGGAWQQVATPITGTLHAVVALSTTEAYAVGETLPNDTRSHGLILHWDGVTWTQVLTTNLSLYAVALTGPGEGWAGGNDGIYHLAGGIWTFVPGCCAGANGITDFAFDSPTHGWAVGADLSTPLLLEYSGGQWQNRAALLPPGMGGLGHIALTGDGQGGLITGQRHDGSSAILRLRNGAWTLDTVSTADYGFAALAPEALGEAWATLYATNNTSLAAGAKAQHYAGGAWQMVDLPADTPVAAISLLPGRGGWAVGAWGHLLRYSPLAPGQRFYDVPSSYPFASYIEYLAAHGIVGGYADNTFHPTADLTRAQLTKMVVTGLAWPDPPAGQTFADVPPAHPFYSYIQVAAAHGVISGYGCGGPDEPCDAQQRPYFRPATNVTRAQLAKIVVGARGWGPLQPARPTFSDVPPADPFYGYIEQAVAHQVVGGYADATFHPTANATRGQMSKILYLALQP